MRLRSLLVVALVMVGSLVGFNVASAAPTVVDTLTVSGDLVQFAGTLATGSNPTLDFNTGSSKIYDDGQLHIATDDNLYLDADDVWASGVIHVQDLGLSGNVIQFRGGGVNLGNTPSLVFNQGNSRIFEDGSLRLVTDDVIFYQGTQNYFGGHVVVGGLDNTVETLSNAGFSMSGNNDLFVVGSAGIEGDIYTDGSLVTGSTTTYGDGAVTLGAAGNSLQITTGNLRVGNGANDVALNGEDAYIEGALEVDGAIALDGGGTVGGTLTVNNLTVNGTLAPASFTAASMSVTGNTTLGDAAGDTITFNGVAASNLNMNTNLLLNVGNAGTDFDSTGGLTLAGDLVVNGGEVYFTGMGSSVSTTEGTVYYDTDDDNLYVYTGTGWTDLTAGAGGANDDLDEAYNNYGATAATVNIDGQEGQGSLEFVLSDVATDRDFIIDMQGDGDFLIQVDNATAHSFRDNGTVDLAGGYGSTGISITAAGGLSMDGALAVTGTIDVLDSIADSLGDLTIADNLVVTGTSNLQGNVNADAGVDVTGADLTVGGANFSVAQATGNITTAGDLAVNGDDIDADGDLDVRGATGLNLIATTGTLDLSTTAAADVTLTPGDAANLVNILSGNLKVGNGVNGVALNGEDAYIEGTLEVDGQVQLDGNLDATSGVDVTGADLTVGGANFSVAQATGNITTAGDLAVNGDNINSDGALIVNGATGMSLTTTAGDLVVDSAASLDIRDTMYNSAGNVVFSDNVNFLGGANEVTFAPAATFNGNVTINGTTTISSTGTLTIQDPVTITDGNALQALGNIDLGDSAADQLDVDATSNFDAKATFNGEVDMLWNSTENLLVTSTSGDFAAATTMDLFGMTAVVTANTGFATNYDGIDLSITSSDEGIVRGLVITQADGAELFDAGIELVANDVDAGDEVTAGLVYSGAGTFVTGIDLSAATSTVDLRLDDGLTISQTSDNDLDIVENGVTLNMDFAETNAATITTSSASSLEFESTADAAAALKLEATAGGIDIFASGSEAGQDIDIVATGSSVNLQSTEAAADSVTIFANAEGGAVVISGGDTAPDAGENGNDVAIQAEDDFLVETTGDVDMDVAGSFLADAVGGISLDAATASNFSVSAGSLSLQATDGGNAGTFSVVLSSGNAAPDAAEDGNDVAVEAEDDFLVETTDDADFDVAGDFLVDATGLISLDAATGSNFTASAGTLTLAASDAGNAGTFNVVLSAGNAAPDAAEDGNDVVFEAEDDILFEAGDAIDFDLAGAFNVDALAISLDATNPSNFTVTSDGDADDLTISVAGATDSSLVLQSTGTGADAIDMNATAGGMTVDVVTALSIDVTGATGASNISVVANADAEDLTVETTGTEGDVVVSSADDLSLLATVTDGGNVALRAGDNAAASTADGNDVFVGAEDDIIFNATDDVTFAGDDFTWTLGATGQMIVDAATTDNTTVGATAGVLQYTIDANPAATSQNNGMFMDYEALNDANADQTFVAMNISMTVTEDDAGDTTYAMLLENGAAGASALDALLRLNNADADTAVTTGLLIDSSGNGGITTAIDINDTDVTTDIQFQNDATLANNTNGDVVMSENARNLTFDFDAVASRIQMSSFSELQVVTSADGAASMTISSDLGGIDITANAAGAGEDIDITATGSSVNITATEAANDAITLFASTDTASMTLRAGDNADASTANGNDIFLGAEDDVLIDANGDVDITANILDLNLSGDSIWAMANTAAYVEIDAATVDTTTTTGVFDMNVDAGNAAVDALNIDLEAINGIAAGTNITAMEILMTASDADADMFGMTITGAATAVAGADSYEAGIVIDNAEDTVGSMPDAILITASGGNGTVTDAIDASAANINNALNAGDNTITGNSAVINFSNFDVAGDGGITIAAGQELDTSAAGALSIGNTNATSLVLGGAAVTAVTITTDNTGDGTDLVLPAQSVNGTEVLNDTLSLAQMADSMDLDANLSFNNTASNYSITLGDNQGAVVINSNDWDITAAGNVTGLGSIAADGAITFDGTFDANNAITLGDNGDAVSIDSNAWDIDANGVVTGIRTITAAAASTYDLGSNTTEWDEIYVGDDNGVIFGLDQDAELAYDELTDNRMELAGTGASLFIEDRLSLGRQTLTMVTGGAANENLTPTASYVEVTGQDAATDAVSIQTASAKEGDILIITNLDATDVLINAEATTKIAAGADVTLTQYDVMMLIFDGTNWLQVASVAANS